jgi:hypothetical protein
MNFTFQDDGKAVYGITRVNDHVALGETDNFEALRQPDEGGLVIVFEKIKAAQFIGSQPLAWFYGHGKTSLIDWPSIDE